MGMHVYIRLISAFAVVGSRPAAVRMLLTVGPAVKPS